METKSCPNCGAVVPAIAYRCKDCFQDFAEKPTQRGGKGVVMVLATLAAMALGASYITSWQLQQPTSIRTLVNGDNRTVQVIREFNGGRIETDQVTFDQVSRIEYGAGGTSPYRITAVTADGRRLDLEVSDSPGLLGKAESHSKQIGRPLDIVDRPPGEAAEAAGGYTPH